VSIDVGTLDVAAIRQEQAKIPRQLVTVQPEFASDPIRL
jgi:hypothetical protein